MTQVKVCAHISLGHTHGNAQYFERFESIQGAVKHFRDQEPSREAGEQYEAGVMDLYPQCDQCTYRECYHDYPMARYTVGPCGGVVNAARSLA